MSIGLLVLEIVPVTPLVLLSVALSVWLPAVVKAIRLGKQAGEKKAEGKSSVGFKPLTEMTDQRRDFDAAQVHPPEADTVVGRRRDEGNGDFLAGMQSDARAIDRSTQGTLQRHPSSHPVL